MFSSGYKNTRMSEDRYFAGRKNQHHYLDPQDNYQQHLATNMFIPSQPSSYFDNPVRSMLSRKSQYIEPVIKRRNIKLSPQKVLDAPQLRDDYYLNLLDWGKKGQIAIGLSENVYLYSASQIVTVSPDPDQYVCSVAFSPQGQSLIVGLSSGQTHLYDVQTATKVRKLKDHNNRVSSSAFTYGMIFTGSKDTTIIGHDHRSYSNIIFSGHRGQVCGLKHDPCGLASGSNDNSAMIWDLYTGKARHQLLGHTAAVKALAWCPWQRNLLATGGGTNDQSMKFWNAQTGRLISNVVTQSQVCSLIWSRKQKQILSSHGFSQNQLTLWRYPNYSKIADLHGHGARVLHMALSPDETTVVSASADQTLRFWKVFDHNEDNKMEQQKSVGVLPNKQFCLR